MISLYLSWTFIKAMISWIGTNCIISINIWLHMDIIHFYHIFFGFVPIHLTNIFPINLSNFIYLTKYHFMKHNQSFGNMILIKQSCRSFIAKKAIGQRCTNFLNENYVVKIILPFLFLNFMLFVWCFNISIKRGKSNISWEL